jgi:molybdate-binding protein
MAVARGDAEIALATRAWAQRAGPGFLAFVTQGYRLAIGTDDLGDPRLVAMCEHVQTAAYRRRLIGEHGYDASHAGELRFGTSSRAT